MNERLILDQVKMAMNAKLMPYGALLDYRYKNLCVKTSTEALLAIEVRINNSELPLEDCAKAGIVDDEHFMIAPASQELVNPVCQAFLQCHPQLKQELYTPTSNPYISEATRNKIKRDMEIFKEQTGEDLVLPQILILTTPEIDDNQKDVMNKSVDALEKQCEVLYKKEYAKFKAELSAKLADKDVRTAEECEKAFDNEYQKLWMDVEKYTEEERMAIDEANQRYHNRKEGNNNNSNAPEVYQTMKMGEYEE